MYHVLIIDDEPWSREVVKSLGDWEGLGLRVIGEAEDGNSGIQEIERLSPHIVVTDMRMPGLEGVELLKKIRQSYPTIKLLVMSGYDDYTYLRQAIRSQAHDYLLKPIDPEQLNRAFASCVDKLNQERKLELETIHPILFQTPELLDSYHAHRERIVSWLSELNTGELGHAFARFKHFLDEALSGELNSGVLMMMTRDMTAPLEQFAADHDINLDHLIGSSVIERSDNELNVSVNEAVDRIASLYTRVIDEIIELRKQKQLDMADVQSYIDRHFTSPISLELVARQFLVSREHISREFKARTGTTISDYILHKRMMRAREALLEEGRAIKQVAELCGYNDITYFYRVFRKYWGMPPGEMRQEPQEPLK